MLHNIYRENAVNCVLKRRLTAVGPFSRNKSHIVYPIFSNFSKKIFQPCFSLQNIPSYAMNLGLLLLIFLVSFTSTEKSNQKKGNTLTEFRYNKKDVEISKEIWQMVILSENEFKGNLMLQFSWLEEFR